MFSLRTFDAISLGRLASAMTGASGASSPDKLQLKATASKHHTLQEGSLSLTSVGNLALVLQDQGKYEAAEEMNRRALEGREKVLGVEHPDTLTSVYNLAYLFHHQQRYNDASVLYLRASAGLPKTLGPDHPTTRSCSYYYSSMIREMEGQGRDV